MTQTFIVFVIGTTLSFFPIFWLLLKFDISTFAVGQRQVKRTSSPRRTFQNLLKREAFDRAVAALASDQLDCGSAHQDNSVHRCFPNDATSSIKNDYHETISMVEALFSEKSARIFQEAVEKIRLSPSAHPNHLVHLTRVAISHLSDELEFAELKLQELD